MLDKLKDLFALIKPYIAPKLIGWVLKVLAGVFGTLGIETGVQEGFVNGLVEIVLAAVLFGLGALISLIQNKKAVQATPPAPNG